MGRRHAGRALLALLALVLAVAFFAAGGPSDDVALLVALLASALFPVVLVALGASRREKGPRLRTVLTVLAVLLAGSLVALWWLRGLADPPLVAGLPLPFAVLVFGVFLLPQLVVGLGYAWTFSTEEEGEG